MQFNEIKRIILDFLGRLCDFLYIVFWLLVIFGFDEPYVAVLTVISVIIHEIGHELCIRRFFGRARLPVGKANGLKIKAGAFQSYRQEILTYTLGPAANLGAAAVGILASLFVGEYALTFAILNAVTALTNLLPIKGQDGYGIISVLIRLYEMDETFDAILSYVSLVLSAFLCFFSLYLLNTVGEGLWIFGAFYVSLFSSLKCRSNNNL